MNLPGNGPLGILAALPEEIADLQDIVRRTPGGDVRLWGQREFVRGQLMGQDCVIALSRVGKVAAATTAATMIHRFDVSRILFTGVAGGIAPEVQVGDVVIGASFVQHDMNAEPLFSRFEIPLLDRAHFNGDTVLTNALMRAAQSYLPATARVHRGLIASGDQFVGTAQAVSALRAALPDLLAVDMESAAVAQVCFEHDVPLAVMRSISDSADEAAAVSFATFLRDIASHYASGVVKAFLRDVVRPNQTIS